MIYNNSALGTSYYDGGGGVYCNAGTFAMSGGKICGNYATKFGGGVGLAGSGKMTMTGGVIGDENASTIATNTQTNGINNYSNRAADAGSGVSAYSNWRAEANWNATPCEFHFVSGIIAYNYGAAINVRFSKCYLGTDDETANLTAPIIRYNSGQGIDINDGGIVTIYDMNITNNGSTGIYGNGGSSLTATGGSITNNNGGGISGWTPGTRCFTLSNVTISGNTSSQGAGVNYYSAGATFTNCTITNNTSTGNGGGIWCNNSSTTTPSITLIGCTISNNTAGSNSSGGGIMHDRSGGIIVISNCTITGNTAAYGAGIRSIGTATITDTTISNNRATSNGALHLANATIDGCTISGNTGNAIYAQGSNYSTRKTLIITDTEISGNTGKGINLMYMDATIDDGTQIINNTSTGQGGGIYAEICSVSLLSCTISGNSAPYGGGIYNQNGQLTINGATISANSTNNSSYGGAAIGQNTGTATTFGEVFTRIISGTISNNTASSFGGGVLIINGSLYIEGGTISGNTAAIGGGICINSNDAVVSITGGSITGNTATNYGGGIYAKGTTTISGGTISGNTASGNGGAVYIKSGSLAISTGTNGANQTTIPQFVSNIATDCGGAIYSDYGAINITGGSFYGNSVVNYDGAGVYMLGGTLNFGGTAIIGDSTKTIVADSSNYSNIARCGAAILLTSNAEANITGGIIAYNYARNRGGAIAMFTDSCKLNITGGTISVNKANDNGGAIYSKGTCSFSGGTISGNSSANLGGGIFSDTGSFEIISGTISNNSAANGGGISSYKGQLSISGGTFSGNSAETFGGAIYLQSQDASASINGGTFSGNSAASSGGAIYHKGPLLVEDKIENGEIVDSPIFLNNTASYGGGITNMSSLILTGGRISNNTSTGPGGGIYSGSNNLSITGGIISNNTAGTAGGGLTANKITEMRGVTISNNTAGTYGGGMYVTNGTTTADLINVTISHNSAQKGGGVYVTGYCTISGNTLIDSNTSSDVGAGIWSSSTLTISGGTISGNTASSSGGGIYSYGTSANPATLTMSAGTISGNTATNSGGGVIMNSGTLTLADTIENNVVVASPTISGNTATNGAQIYLNSSAYIVAGSTLSNNYSVYKGGITSLSSGDTASAYIAYSDVSANLASALAHISVVNMPSSTELSTTAKADYLVVVDTAQPTYVSLSDTKYLAQTQQTMSSLGKTASNADETMSAETAWFDDKHRKTSKIGLQVVTIDGPVDGLIV